MRAIGHGIDNQLAIEDGVAVESALALVRRKVCGLNPPVIILAVDQVVQLLTVAVVGQVEEVADAVRLFANVVADSGGQSSSQEPLDRYRGG